MFLQETKTKRGGKTYVSYLVRESFRTANGPRGRTICNLTHLPKEVRDMVANALRGKSLVPLESLEVHNIHGFGGCVVLEEAARRHGLPAILAPLTPRNGALAQAMILGGLLFPPSAAPFSVESRTARLAMFCGLDPEKERFDSVDLAAALRELDERWPLLQDILTRSPHGEVRAITLFRTGAGSGELGALGIDADGIPISLTLEKGVAFPGFLERAARQSKSSPPLLLLEEEMATRLKIGRQEKQPYLIELAPDSLATLLRQLNQAQLVDAFRTGRHVEVRHHENRHILAPIGTKREGESQASPVRMGSLKELTSITGHGGMPGADGFRGLATNVPAERLTAAAAMEWAQRARMARAAFAPMQIVIGGAAAVEGAFSWRSHWNLQFLTHWLRCHLHTEWKTRGEERPVEEVLRDLQEVHRATLTVDGVVVRRLATQPSTAVGALLTKLNLWELFQPGG